MCYHDGMTHPRLIFWLLPTLALTVPAVAQEGPGHTPAGPGAIVPNRPGFTNGSATVAPRDALAENGLAVTRAQASAGGLETLDLTETNVRVGLTPVLEADIGLPDYFDAHGGGRGFGDGAVGVKYKFYQSGNGSTKASVAPSLTLPTHTSFSSGAVDPTLLLGIQTASGSRWSVASNLVLSNPTVSDRRIFTTTVSSSVAYTLTQPLSVYLDAFDVVPREGPASPTADGGVIYLVNPNLQLDAELYVGLGGAAPVRALALGVSFRL